MISYLVDGVLLVALIITSLKMFKMYGQLKKLSEYHPDYQRILDQTNLALEGIEVSIQEINVRGAQVLNALGSRIDEARDIISDIDGLTREAKKHQKSLQAEMKTFQIELERERAHWRKTNSDSARNAQAATSQATRRQESAAQQARDEEYERPSNAPPPYLKSQMAPSTTEPRIHKISTDMAGPFRSVSLNTKEFGK